MTKGRTPPTPFTGEQQGRVEVTSGYGANTRVPFVELTLPERAPIQLEIDEARLVDQMILEACEAAEQDAFLVEWTMEHLDLELPHAAALLREFRAWRERRREKQRTESA